MKTITTKANITINIMATPADILYNRPEPTPVAPKNRDYCIIDHIGSLESDVVMSQAYSIAYSLTQHPKTTYTMKKFCQMLSRNPETKVSDKQKNFVRFNKHPEQVILICSGLNTRTKWLADVWAEKADDITVIECVGDQIEVYTAKDLHPEWFSCKDPVDSIYRRCANIWSRALGWQFSAPLYRDKASEIDVMKYKRSDAKLFKDQPGAHVTKTNHSPAAYLNSKTLASEDECREFFNYYKYLRVNKLVEESLIPGYQLCPVCGRPIAIDKAMFDLNDLDKYELDLIPEHKDDRYCDSCNLRIPAELITNVDAYWDDSFHIYYTEEGMAFGCKNE